MELQALALECEFPFEWKDGDCHLWFFLKGLPGYSWYVPKTESYLNVGLGAIGQKLKKRGTPSKTTGTFFWNIWKGFSRYLKHRSGRQDTATFFGEAKMWSKRTKPLS